MNLDAYFNRIGYTGSQDASLETLQQLHLLHPQAIPFENLSSFVAQGDANSVSLDPEAVFDKLVVNGRGGYCFEQNLLFAEILTALGFEVSTHAARVIWRGVEKSQAPRTHMLLKISLDGSSYIADVGFGGLTMTAPILLVSGSEQTSPHEKFRITSEDEPDTYTISALLGDTWKSMYVFDLSSQQAADYELANYYVSTHCESPFVNNLIVARPFKNGRHALMNNSYAKYTRDGQKIEKEISDKEELLSLLKDIFKIRLEGTLDNESLGKKLDAIAAQ